MTPFHAVKTSAVDDVARHFGFKDGGALLRRAFSSRNPERASEGWRGTLGLGGRMVGEFARQQVLGDPYTAYRQIKHLRHQTGSMPRALGEYMRGYHWRYGEGIGRGVTNALNMYGLGRNVTDAILTKDPEQRKGDLAAVGTQMITMPFTSRMGLLGSAAQAGINKGVRALVQKQPQGTIPNIQTMPPTYSGE